MRINIAFSDLLTNILKKSSWYYHLNFVDGEIYDLQKIYKEWYFFFNITSLFSIVVPERRKIVSLITEIGKLGSKFLDMMLNEKSFYQRSIDNLKL